MKKQDLLRVLKNDGMQLKHTSDEDKSDKEIVLAAVSQNILALQYADQSLKKDKDVVLAAVSYKNSTAALEFADATLRADEAFIHDALWAAGDCHVLRYADHALRANKNVVLNAVTLYGDALKYADPSLQKDKEVVLCAVSSGGYDGCALQYVDPSLQKDKEVVLAAVLQDGFSLAFADSSLQKDKEVVLEAVSRDEDALEHADPSLKKDKDVVLAAVSYNGFSLQYADPSLYKDKDVVLAAVSQNGYVLEYADPSLKKDPEVVLAAVSEDRGALEYADPSLQKDKVVVLAAASKKLEILRYVDPSLKKDKAFMLEALSQNVGALEYADSSLKKDKAFMLEAVSKNAIAYAYVDPSLALIKFQPYTLSYDVLGHDDFINNKFVITALASPHGDGLKSRVDTCVLQYPSDAKTLLTAALGLAVKSDDANRLTRFLEHYGHHPAYFYDSELLSLPDNHQEPMVWTGHHVAVLKAIIQKKWDTLDALISYVEWPERSMPLDDAFLLLFWKAVQNIAHHEHPTLYRMLYLTSINCLTVDTQDMYRLENALIRTASIIKNLQGYTDFYLSEKLLTTLKAIMRDVQMYQNHLNTPDDPQSKIQPWRFKPLNDMLTEMININFLFDAQYQRITDKTRLSDDQPLAQRYLQEVEIELSTLQGMIRGEQNSIYHSIWSMGEGITTLSFFSQTGQEYMTTCDHDLETSSPATKKQKITSS
ncbi:MAG: DUF4116 domain-containing protein [Pseudomonadota bacterium]|nr:DUF4116 domain-containing protein [Pseudomonadota bacterium]